MNIRAETPSHIEESVTIHCRQVDKLDRLDIGNIDHISKDVILLRQKIICRGS